MAQVSLSLEVDAGAHLRAGLRHVVFVEAAGLRRLSPLCPTSDGDLLHLRLSLVVHGEERRSTEQRSPAVAQSDNALPMAHRFTFYLGDLPEAGDLLRNKQPLHAHGEVRSLTIDSAAVTPTHRKNSKESKAKSHPTLVLRVAVWHAPRRRRARCVAVREFDLLAVAPQMARAWYTLYSPCDAALTLAAVAPGSESKQPSLAAPLTPYTPRTPLGLRLRSRKRSHVTSTELLPTAHTSSDVKRAHLIPPVTSAPPGSAKLTGSAPPSKLTGSSIAGAKSVDVEPVTPPSGIAPLVFTPHSCSVSVVGDETQGSARGLCRRPFGASLRGKRRDRDDATASLLGQLQDQIADYGMRDSLQKASTAYMEEHVAMLRTQLQEAHRQRDLFEARCVKLEGQRTALSPVNRKVGTISTLQARVAGLEKQLYQAEDHADSLSAKYGQALARIDDLRDENTSLRSLLERLKEALLKSSPQAFEAAVQPECTV